MRIAIVAPLYRPAIGGVETHVEQLATRLAAAGQAVEVITQTDDAGLPSIEVLDGVMVRRFRVLAPSEHYPFAPGLARFLHRHGGDYDLIHAHNYHALPALVAAIAAKGPFVFTPHYHGRSDSRFRGALHRAYRLPGSRIIERAAKVIAVAPAEAQLLADHFPGAAARIVIIPNGVDAERISAAEPFEEDGSTVVLCAGRIARYKRLDRTIRALSHLEPRFVLRITGEGPQRPELESLVRELGLAAAGPVPRQGGRRRAVPLVPHRGRLRDDVGDRGDAGHPARSSLRGREGRGQRHPCPPRDGPLCRRAPQPGPARRRAAGSGCGDPGRRRGRSSRGNDPDLGNRARIDHGRLPRSPRLNPRPMRILQVCDHYPPDAGGLATHVRRLSGHLASRGHEVRVVAAGAEAGDLDGEGFEATRVPSTFSRLPGVYEPGSPPFHPPWPDRSFVRGLESIAEDFGPDVVHAHGWSAFSVAAASGGWSRSAVCTLHDYGLACPKKSLLRFDAECGPGRGPACLRCDDLALPKRAGLALALERGVPWLGQRIRLLLAVSNHVSRRVAGSGVEPGRLRVVPNFVDLPPAAEPGPGEAHRPPGDAPDSILFVGPAAPHKGRQVLLEAFRGLRRRGIELKLAGGDGTLTAPGVIDLGRRGEAELARALPRRPLPRRALGVARPMPDGRPGGDGVGAAGDRLRHRRPDRHGRGRCNRASGPPEGLGCAPASDGEPARRR